MPLVLNSSSITGLASSGGFSSRQTGEVLQVVNATYSTEISTTSTSYAALSGDEKVTVFRCRSLTSITNLLTRCSVATV